MRHKFSLLVGSLITLTVLSASIAVADTNNVTLLDNSQEDQPYLQTPPGEKPRIVVTTDPELDDANSMIRYLLYSSDYNTMGLIYSSSAIHWSGDMRGTKFSLPNREYSRPGVKACPCTSYRWPTGQLHIDRAIDAYEEVYNNLIVHNSSYPLPSYLRSIVRWGNTEFEGEMSHDTAGSHLIRSLLLDEETSPVYLLAWGGESTIARALKSIEDDFGHSDDWPSIRRKVISKAVIVSTGHQDNTYENYLKPVWPLIRYLERTGGVPLGYGAQSQVSLDDTKYFTAEWMANNVLNRGPLGEMYRIWGDGIQMVPEDPYDYFGERGKTAQELEEAGFIVWTPPQEVGSFISEGDTPTFLDFIDNGLNGFGPSMPGGWSGHLMTQADRERMAEIYRLYMSDPLAVSRLPRAASHPFLGAAQRDFAARLLWSTSSAYPGANHNPRIMLTTPAVVTARPGQTVHLGASASDPDNDTVMITWWRWSQADDYPGEVTILNDDGPQARFRVPDNARAGQVFQVIAEAVDSGSPSLSHYAKVSVTVAH